MDPNVYRLNDPSFFALGDPEAVFKSMRREDPVHWTKTNLQRGFWSITTMPDVMAVFRDAHTFPSGVGGFFLPLIARPKPHSRRLPPTPTWLSPIRRAMDRCARRLTGRFCRARSNNTKTPDANWSRRLSTI